MPGDNVLHRSGAASPPMAMEKTMRFAIREGWQDRRRRVVSRKSSTNALSIPAFRLRPPARRPERNGRGSLLDASSSIGRAAVSKTAWLGVQVPPGVGGPRQARPSPSTRSTVPQVHSPSAMIKVSKNFLADVKDRAPAKPRGPGIPKKRAMKRYKELVDSTHHRHHRHPAPFAATSPALGYHHECPQRVSPSAARSSSR